MTGAILTVWVIYENPRDFPGKHVLRAQDVFTGNPEPVTRKEAFICDSLEAARKALPEYQTYEHQGRTWGTELVRLERNPEDDPTIVECWI